MTNFKVNSGGCHVKRGLMARSLILILLLNVATGNRKCVPTSYLLVQAGQGVLLCQLGYSAVGLGRARETGQKSKCCNLRHCSCQLFSRLGTSGNGFSSWCSRDRAAGSHINRHLAQFSEWLRRSCSFEGVFGCRCFRGFYIATHQLAGMETCTVLSTLESWLPLGSQELWWILIIKDTLVIFFSAHTHHAPPSSAAVGINISHSTSSFHTTVLWHCKRLVPAVSKDETALNVIIHVVWRFARRVLERKCVCL